MTVSTAYGVAEQLRAWAAGMYHTEAAVELLIRGMGGRFARPENRWIIKEAGTRGSLEPRYWVDFEAIPDHI